ncbi:MAG: Cadherin-like beta sandwich domain protein [Proteobacteria bacterium]|nr:Cadherin-like beta sandwich domain protein [Pseudomonadota bacterium]
MQFHSVADRALGLGASARLCEGAASRLGQGLRAFCLLLMALCLTAVSGADGLAMSASCSQANSGGFSGNYAASLAQLFEPGERIKFSVVESPVPEGINIWSGSSKAEAESNLSNDIKSSNPNSSNVYTYDITVGHEWIVWGSGDALTRLTWNVLCVSAANVPSVVSISPTGGTAAGGTSVTITGTNLLGATSVSFGGVEAAGFSVDSATQITATTPPHAAGSVAVTVMTTSNGDATLANGFTYVDAPVAGDISLTVAANSGANPITLNLSGGAATSVAVASAASHGTATAVGTTITYTPTAGYAGADSFTYTATNLGGTSFSAAVSITVTPTLTITPGSGPLPAATIRSPYSATFTLVSGSINSYSLSGTAPPGVGDTTPLPNGFRLSITPTALGTFAFHVTLSTDNGDVSADYSVTVVAATPTLSLTASPSSAGVGVPVTLTAVLAGGWLPTGTIQFKAGGTNVGSPVPLAGGTATVITSALPDGAHSITAVYSGDGNNAGVTSPAVTVAIGTAGRSDPSQNQTVTAMVTAQASSSARFGQAQITNTVQRLEQLHDEEAGAGTGDGNQTADAADSGPRLPDRSSRGGYALTTLAYGESAAREPSADTSPGEAASQVLGQLSGAFEAAERKAQLPFHLWSSGSVDWGRSDSSGDDRFTTSGFTIGLDRRMTDWLTMGVAGGVGLDRSTFGADSSSDGTAYTAQLYASLKLAPETWLDLVGGYGALKFDSERWSGADRLDGARDGHDLFGSLGLSTAREFSGLKLTGYGRLDIVKVALDGYAESGPSAAALAYDDMDATTLAGVAGLRAAYALPMSWGTLTPGGRIEYRHALDGGFTQHLGYADFGGFGSAISGDSSARDSATFGLSLGATTLDGLNLDLDYSLSADGDGVGSQRVRAGLRMPF